MYRQIWIDPKETLKGNIYRDQVIKNKIQTFTPDYFHETQRIPDPTPIIKRTEEPNRNTFERNHIKGRYNSSDVNKRETGVDETIKSMHPKYYFKSPFWNGSRYDTYHGKEPITGKYEKPEAYY